jgi:hypothetical protein
MQSKFRQFKNDLSRPRPNCEIPLLSEDLAKMQYTNLTPQNNPPKPRYSQPQTD